MIVGLPLVGVAVRDPVNGEIPKAARKAQARSNHVSERERRIGRKGKGDRDEGEKEGWEERKNVYVKEERAIADSLPSQRQSSGVLMSREGLTSEEAAVVRETKEEYARRGSFVRIFPTADSWDLYG